MCLHIFHPTDISTTMVGLSTVCLMVWPAVMGLGQNFWPRLGRVIFLLGSGQPPLTLENFHLTIKFFSLRIKNISWVESKNTRVSLLFTTGQKYARVSSDWVRTGPISSLNHVDFIKGWKILELQTHTIVVVCTQLKLFSLLSLSWYLKQKCSASLTFPSNTF